MINTRRQIENHSKSQLIQIEKQASVVDNYIYRKKSINIESTAT